jgi:hypothetical protein
MDFDVHTSQSETFNYFLLPPDSMKYVKDQDTLDSNVDLIFWPLVISVIGSVTEVIGLIWDNVSHLIHIPETFFTPGHDVLYSGIGIIVYSAGVLGCVVLSKKCTNLLNKDSNISKYLKILVVGAALSMIAGPFDYWWHSNFGFSADRNPLPLKYEPAHLMLSVGFLLVTMATSLAILHLEPFVKIKRKWVTIVKIMAFATFGYAIMVIVYGIAFPAAAPVTNSKYVDMDRVLSAIIVVVIVPIVVSIAFVIASLRYSLFSAEPKSKKSEGSLLSSSECQLVQHAVILELRFLIRRRLRHRLLRIFYAFHLPSNSNALKSSV